MENGRFAFLSFRLVGLGATYDVHLRLIRKRIANFLSVLIIFFARCYGWCATSEYRLKIDDFAPTASVWPKISGRMVRRSPTILLLRKLLIYDKSSFMWYKNLGRTFFCFVTIHAFDRRTDGQTDRQTPFSWLPVVHAGIPWSAVKKFM